MSKNTTPVIETSSVNLIGNGTEIIGNIQLTSDIRVDGKITGNIQSTGRVLVGNSGEIEGNVYCKAADVAGKIKGNVTASENITLKSNACIIGDLATIKLSVELGAQFTGMCKVSPEELPTEPTGK